MAGQMFYGSITNPMATRTSKSKITIDQLCFYSLSTRHDDHFPFQVLKLLFGVKFRRKEISHGKLADVVRLDQRGASN
jgi:hypothetical protein